MADQTMPPARYSLWQTIAVALNLGMRALEEVRALARDGGKPGPPGLGWDDMSIEHDGGRRLTLRFQRGSNVFERTIVFPAMIYRGVHDERAYEPGDVVTWGGAMWHCNEQTSDKPKANLEAWTLCVKAGRDGRDGKEGPRGATGPEGKAGRDLTQLGPNGAKW